MVKANLLNRILLILAFVGLFVSCVLSMEAAANVVVPCTSGGGCETVANHPSSRIAGIPVAFLGVIGYLGLAAIAFVRSKNGVTTEKQLVMLGFGMSVLGSAFSLYLQYTSFFVIKAFCPWCFTSAVAMLSSLVVHALLIKEINREGQVETMPKPETKLVMALVPALVIGVFLVISGAKSASQQVLPPDADVEFVPEGAHMLGRKEAPFTVVEFADILCPACQKSSPLVKQFVLSNPGRLRLVYRHYPLEKIHPQAMITAALSEVAADEGKFWEFVEVVMTKGGKPESPNEIFEDARIAGLDVTSARKRLENENDPIYGRIARDLQAVSKAKVTGTPTFFFLVKDKVIATAGPQDVMDKLNDPKIQSMMGPMMGSTGVVAPTKG